MTHVCVAVGGVTAAHVEAWRSARDGVQLQRVLHAGQQA